MSIWDAFDKRVVGVVFLSYHSPMVKVDIVVVIPSLLVKRDGNC